MFNQKSIKMNKTYKCPSCNKGKMKITMIEGEKKMISYISCIDCGGTERIDEETKEFLFKEKSTWCECEQPDDEYYVPDGVDDECQKHHWNCGICDKIVQIG